MTKAKYYYSCKFSSKIINEVYDKFLSLVDKKNIHAFSFSITKNDETWEYDTFQEFLSEYKNANDFFFYMHTLYNKNLTISTTPLNNSLRVTVESNKRDEIESIFQIFEKNLDESSIKIEKEPMKIFIGHGHSKQWRNLKDHLHEKHGFEVIAYEIGPRAGLSIKEVLESMLNESSFALLVLTGEDIDSEGLAHARENVIHELGLFQGKLGFTKAIAMLEKDVNEFSNILGINQIRFSNENIKETYGEILSIIKREFSEDKN